ncbi:MAG: leucine-rich repeat protein [Hespellia sp.]|nr:leucine-rich repeat protein [Hespellia sp.]
MKKYTDYIIAITTIVLFIVVGLAGRKLEQIQFNPDNITAVQASLKEKEVADSEETGVPASAAAVEQNHTDIVNGTNKIMTDSILKSESNVNTEIIPDLKYPAEHPDTSKPENSGSVETPTTLPKEEKTGFDINANGMLEHFRDGDQSVDNGYLALPSEGCIGICSGAFLDYSGSITEIYIPSSVTEIEAGAFAGLPTLEWLETDHENPSVSSEDGVVYRASKSELLAFPPARVGNFSVPESVTAISDAAFYHTSLVQLDLLGSVYVTFGKDVFGPNAGAGLTIRVPKKYENDYRTALSGYAVQIIGVGE